MAYRKKYRKYSNYKKRYKKPYRKVRKYGKMWSAGRGTPSAFEMNDSYSRGCIWH